MKDFINELYLNQSIEINLDNTIYLTTIHGSKGLEWEYVYLIDVDSDTFPSAKYGYYLDEGDEIEEERPSLSSSLLCLYSFLYLLRLFWREGSGGGSIDRDNKSCQLNISLRLKKGCNIARWTQGRREGSGCSNVRTKSAASIAAV